MLKSFGLTGRSDHKVDAKGRINIPSQMRRILAPNSYDEVVISLSREGYLAVFNKDYWVSTIQQNIMNQADSVGSKGDWDSIQRAIHRLSENSHMSTVDSQGRITIPQWLLEKASKFVAEPSAAEGLGELIDAVRSGPPNTTLIRRTIRESRREEVQDLIEVALFSEEMDIENLLG